MGAPVSQADIDKYVTVEVEKRQSILDPSRGMVNSNYFIFKSEGLQANTAFEHGLGSYIGANAKIQGAVVSGPMEIVVTVLSPDGSKATKKFPVVVDECFDVAPEWELLCGSGSKSWTWDDRVPFPYGNGAQYQHSAPAWWQVPISDLNGQGSGEGANATMTFSAVGSKLVLNRNNGNTANASGTFSFDMSKKMIQDGVTWSHGQLTTNAVSILVGKGRYNFEILKLTEDALVLGWLTEGNAEYYMFKSVD
jgi:hypothetical protein